MQSVPSPTEQMSKQKSLKLSTSVPELRNFNPKGHITSPIIGPRTSSMNWETKSNNSSSSTISAIIKEVDPSNENPVTPPINNNDKCSTSLLGMISESHLPESFVPPAQHNNNSSVIQQQYPSNVLPPSEDTITSPLSPRRTNKRSSSHSSHGRTNVSVCILYIY